MSTEDKGQLISNAIRRLFGDSSGKFFDTNYEELKIFSRSLSLNSLQKTEKDLHKLLLEMSINILSSTVSVYLNENYSSVNGDLEVNVGYGKVYDKNINEIKSISFFKRSNTQFLKIMTDECMELIRKGRYLSLNILGSNMSLIKEDRNYKINPPKEMIEIEIMRLERKGPNLSKEEVDRLAFLYKGKRDTK